MSKHSLINAMNLLNTVWGGRGKSKHSLINAMNLLNTVCVGEEGDV